MKHHETLEHSSFDATISALDAETSAIAQRSFDATVSALHAETSALNAEMSAIVQSFRRYQRGVFGDCGVYITPQMCNRVTNHGDMGTFSKPGCGDIGKATSALGATISALERSFQRYRRGVSGDCRVV